MCVNIGSSCESSFPAVSYTRIDFPQKQENILQRLKKIYYEKFFIPDSSLRKELKKLAPEELTLVIHSFFKEMIGEQRSIEDPTAFLDRLAAIIPAKNLQKVASSTVFDVVDEAKSMVEEAKLYLQETQNKYSLNIVARISSIIDGLIVVIDSIVAAFGIGNFFKSADNELVSDFRSQKIFMLLHLFSMVSAIVLPLLGAATGGAIIGGIILSIAALSIVWPYFKPMPLCLPYAENWTKQVAKKGEFVAQGRRESLDEIASILKMQRHAILVGPSRVGKSLTAKAFTKFIENDPELKGKTVFRINTTDIIGQTSSFLGGGNKSLSEISAKMGRHRDNIILVLDEIHMACKNNEKIADQLKTFLDDGGDFPHVIGITTEEEYKEHVKNNTAFSLRFDKVEIKNTDQDETLKILSDTLLKSRTKPLVEGGVLEYVYNVSTQAKEDPQPATALKLLKQCIHRTEKTQKSLSEKKIIEVSNKILSLRSQAVVSRKRSSGLKEQILVLEKQLKELQEVVSKEKSALQSLFKSKELLHQVVAAKYRCVLKVSATAGKKLLPDEKEQVSMFILLHIFFEKILESMINEQSKALGVKIVIDKDLVDEVKAER